MKKILLNDLLNMQPDMSNIAKVRFNQSNSIDDPMDIYLREPELVNTRWLFWRTKQRYFQVGQIAVCLLKLSWDTWLLTTIKRVTKELDVYDGINYEGEELEEYRQYYGRVILKYHKTAQIQGMHYNTVCNDLEVLQVLPTVFDGEEFPGYDNVRLTWHQLESILERRKQSWIAALENQKAVYLITDCSNGKLYVGSATSDNGMLLQRWSNYAQNGHGGNNYNAAVAEYVKGKDILPICPEMMAGMGCPRTPIEIVDSVLMDRNGNNVDAAMREAVAKAMELIRKEDIQCAILQSRSPTCGVNEVYDGSFSGKLIPGSGVLAQALKDAG